jgi:hypothetical protein
LLNLHDLRIFTTEPTNLNLFYIQKNFPTHAEAEVFMNGLLRAANQGQSSRQQIMPTNFSSERDLRDAESAWFRLREAAP